MKKELILLLSILFISIVSCDNSSTENNGQTVKVSTVDDLTLIDTLFAIGRPDSVVRLLNIQISENKNDSKLYNVRAKANFQMLQMFGDASYILTAIKDYRKALELGGNELISNMGLATCYAHVPNYDSTFKYLDAVLQENPNYANAYQLKGTVFMAQGDTSKAISSFQTAVEQNPYLYTSYNELGEMHKKTDLKKALGYYKSAYEYCDGAIPYMYDYAINLQNYADYIVEGNTAGNYMEYYNSAFDVYKEILEIDSTFYPSYFNIGNIEKLLSNTKAADSLYMIALEYSPDNTEIYYNLGVVAEMDNRMLDANSYYSKCIKLDQGYKPAQERLKVINR
jgi:tetratricopeptide (TPR) repeat protein